MLGISHLIGVGAHVVPQDYGKSHVIGTSTTRQSWKSRSGRAYHNEFVIGKRQEQKIFDLDKTIVHLRTALKLVEELSRRNGSVLFVVPTLDDAYRKELQGRKQLFICEGWIGGVLTNFPAFSRRMQRKNEDYYIPTMPDAVVLLTDNSSVTRLAVQETYQLAIPCIAFVPPHPKLPYPIPSGIASPLLMSFYRGLFLQAVREGQKR